MLLLLAERLVCDLAVMLGCGEFWKWKALAAGDDPEAVAADACMMEDERLWLF